MKTALRGFHAMLLLSLAWMLPPTVSAVVSDPVAVLSLEIPARSDAVLAVPVYRAAAFRGKILRIQPVALGQSHRVTVAGQPGWQAGQFVRNPNSVPARPDSFGMLLVTGAREGLWARVIASTENSVTVELPQDESLAGVKTIEADGDGDEIDLAPYWSLASLLPSSLPSGTQLLRMPSKSPGINLKPETVFVFNGTDWRRLVQATAPSVGTGTPPPALPAGSGVHSPGKPAPPVVSVAAAAASTAGSPPQDHEPLPFGSAFILRNNSPQTMQVTLVGAVPMSRHRRLLRTLAAGLRQDQWIGFASPVPEPIGALNVGFSDGDELLVFDNTAPGQNKTPSQILRFDGSAWRADGINVSGTFHLQPAQGYVLRKNATSQPTVFVWQALPSYLSQP